MPSVTRWAPTAIAVAFALSAARAASASGYVFQQVADTTTSAPAGTFSSFAPPAMSQGSAAFLARFNGNTSDGIFLGNGGPLTTVAKNGDVAPAGAFSAFLRPAVSGGKAAFIAGYGPPTGFGVFAGTGVSTTPIALIGDPAPTGSFDYFFTGSPAISASEVAFRARFASSTAEGIFRGNGGPVTTIVQTGDPLPAGPGTFLGFDNPAVSGSTVAFTGFITGGIGIFTGSGGPLTTIVKTGDAAPTGTFTSFSVDGPAISGGVTAFLGNYWVEQKGIFTGSGGSLSTVVKTGDPAPVGTFTDFEIGSLSFSAGKAAFIGHYAGNSGIFVGSGGPLNQVIKGGDPLFGSTVAMLALQRASLDADGSGNLAFAYTLADGRGGVAVAKLTDAADFQEDGDVDAGDLANWRTGFGTSGSATHLQGDADGDLDVDGADFLIWQRHLGAGGSSIAAATPVPEPQQYAGP